VRDWFLRNDGWVSLGQALLWAGLCAASVRPLRAALAPLLSRRTAVALALLGVAGACVSLFVFPTFARHEALGHAGSYAHIYWGMESPAYAIEEWEAYVTYSLLRWVYWGLGAVLQRTDLLYPLLLNAGARGLGIVGVGLFALLWSRRPAVGLAAAAVLLVDPVHAFWGASIFNLAIPYAVATLCLIQALAAWRSGSGVLLAAAGASGALMVAMRVEWGLLAPALLLVLLSLRESWGRHDAVKTVGFWTPALGTVALLGATLFLGGGDLTSQGGFHDAAGYIDTVRRQVGILAWYPGPSSIPGSAAIVAVVAARWWVSREAALQAIALVAAFGVMHVGLSTFNDYGFRNALLPGLLLVPLMASGVAVAWDDGTNGLRVLAGAGVAGAVLLSGAALLDWADRYYLDGDDHEARCCTGEDRIATAFLSSGACYMITDDETLWEAGVAGSHFNLMEPAEAARHWDDYGGCVTWLRDGFNSRVDELSVQDRALKLDRWFRWERRGWARLPDGSAAEVLQMTAPPAGATRPPATWSGAN